MRKKGGPRGGRESTTLEKRSKEDVVGQEERAGKKLKVERRHEC